MNRKKYYFALALAALLGMFIFQNIAFVEVNIFFWSVYAPRSLILILVFLAGLGSGYMLAHHTPKKSSE